MLKGTEMQSQRVETDILNWTSFQDTGVGGEVLFTLPKKFNFILRIQSFCIPCSFSWNLLRGWWRLASLSAGV